jgi:hypothetical protein
MHTGSSSLDPAIQPAWFTAYKFFNSLFTGLSVGAVFTIYTPLDPEIFSAGGIGLALGMLLIATQYPRLLNSRWFLGISLAVELIMLVAVLLILGLQINPTTALAVYLGYQFTFVFGSYLVRCETLLLAEDRWLTRVDIAKQSGYLLGMAIAWGFYQALESNWAISDNSEQVVTLHYLLLGVEVVVVALLWRAFERQPMGEPDVAQR